MKSKKFMIPTGIIVVGIVAFIGLSSMRPTPPKRAVEIKPTIVETLTVLAEDVLFRVTSQGTVTPRTESVLVAEVSGVVTVVADNYVAGGYFKKGDMLMQVAKIDYEIALQQAHARHAVNEARLAQEKARVKQAEREWALSGRAKKDAPALALRLPNLQEAEANVASSAADLKNAELKLVRTTIRAPYDGMIKAKLVDIGQFVNVGAQLVKTFAVDYAEVRLPLSNSDLEFLQLPQPGQVVIQPIEVLLTATIGKKQYQWNGVMSRSEGLIDTRSRVHYGVVQIDDPYGFKSNSDLPPLTIGSFVKAEINGISMDSVVKIPRTALKGEDTILVMDAENKLQVKKIEITRSQNDWVYLQQGLENGDRVVLTALETAVSGMVLRDQNYRADVVGGEGESQLADGRNKSPVEKNVQSEPLSKLSR